MKIKSFLSSNAAIPLIFAAAMFGILFFMYLLFGFVNWLFSDPLGLFVKVYIK